MTKADLRARWDGQSGQQRADAVYDALSRGASLDALAFGQVDGRHDLRGLHFGEKDLSWGLPIVGQRLSGLDLRWTRAIFRWEECDVRNVVMDGAELGDIWPGMNVARSVVTDCSFRSADLGNASLDHGNGWKGGRSLRAPAHAPSTYTRCDFTRTRFRRYSFFDFAVFEECTFDSTRLPGYDAMQHVSLYRCRFSGKFKSHFFGFRVAPQQGEDLPRMVDVDFTGAEFEEFILCNLTTEPGPPPRPQPAKRGWFGLGR